MRALRLAFVALLASPVFASGAGLAAAVPLIQHRAVYDLKLSDASDSSGITGISGRMVYEIRGSACEGYTVRFRYVTQSDTREASQITDQQTTTFEDAEGKSFSFVTKSYTDQNLDKELRGNATREAAGRQDPDRQARDQELRAAADAVSDAAPRRPDQQGQDRRDLLRDQHLRRLGGCRQGDDHDRRRRQADRCRPAAIRRSRRCMR